MRYIAAFFRFIFGLPEVTHHEYLAVVVNGVARDEITPVDYKQNTCHPDRRILITAGRGLIRKHQNGTCEIVFKNPFVHRFDANETMCSIHYGHLTVDTNEYKVVHEAKLNSRFFLSPPRTRELAKRIYKDQIAIQSLVGCDSLESLLITARNVHVVKQNVNTGGPDGWVEVTRMVNNASLNELAQADKGSDRKRHQPIPIAC